MTRTPFASTCLLIAGALAALLLGSTTALAGGPYGSGAAGTDISWPQCGRGFDSIPTGDFSVVGVNDGEPYTMNPCFGAQYARVRDLNLQTPSLYLNLQYGEADNGYSGCAAGDRACRAHDYGYLAVEYAYTQANFLSGGRTLRGIAAWWLDVETLNSWNDDPNLNAQVIRGALDFLSATGKPVGVYSTPGQWRAIASGYNPGPAIGNWVAGADSLDDGAMCGRPLWPGGQVWLFQYLNDGLDLDQNRSC